MQDGQVCSRRWDDDAKEEDDDDDDDDDDDGDDDGDDDDDDDDDVEPAEGDCDGGEDERHGWRKGSQPSLQHDFEASKAFMSQIIFKDTKCSFLNHCSNDP